MSTPVREYMTPMPHTIGQNIEVSKAFDMMSEHSCHHLPVLNGGHLVGILSDSDLRALRKSKLTENIKVEDVMTDDPVVVPPTEDVFQVAMLMQQKKIGSVIVSADDKSPWGIFTATDALGYLTKK
jgi:acetoin utilization protein AcuB